HVDSDLAEAFDADVEADVTDLSLPENVAERGLADKLFETYVPLYLTRHAGPPDTVVEVYSDLAPVSATVGRAFRLVAMVLLAGLALIYLLQLPIVKRLGKTLRDQNRRLEGMLQAERGTVSRLQELNRLKSQSVGVASALEGQAVRTQFERVSFKEIARAVLGRFGDAQRRVLLRLPDSLPELRTDERLLELLLANLMDNALKFSAPDGRCEVGAMAG